ncbi:mycobactin peptide synthetase MbtE [Nocardia transvalensis]|uniref:Mycobactin peptide synthetase MbtE n=1 Tax=Nocardia transvalensis TaxID=37333 RepID=A0A7W9PBB8_9NOCA|nr:AMP-binding protein [Nocardia transvalensis]MBB5912924.1 mycobactin peptide synthetase MbtE [Nocardia transvalensis]
MTSLMPEIDSVRAEFAPTISPRHRVVGEWATGVELSDVIGIAGLARRGRGIPIVRTAVRCGTDSIDYGEVFTKVDTPGAAAGPGIIGSCVRLLAALVACDGGPVRLGAGRRMSAAAVAAAVADRRAVAAERRCGPVDPALGSADVRLVVAPWGSPYLLVELLAALADGAALIVPTPAERGDPNALAELIATRSVTHVVAPPGALAGLPETGLPTVHRWDVIGTTCPPGLAERLRAVSPGAVASFGYGLADYAGAVARGPLDGTGRVRPIPGARVLVLDEYGRAVPPGTIGAVYAGGAALIEPDGAQADWSRFIPDPFPLEGIGSALCRTGERARWTPEGWLVFGDSEPHRVGRPTSDEILA